MSLLWSVRVESVSHSQTKGKKTQSHVRMNEHMRLYRRWCACCCVLCRVWLSGSFWSLSHAAIRLDNWEEGTKRIQVRNDDNDTKQIHHGRYEERGGRGACGGGVGVCLHEHHCVESSHEQSTDGCIRGRIEQANELRRIDTHVSYLSCLFVVALLSPVFPLRPALSLAQ